MGMKMLLALILAPTLCAASPADDPPTSPPDEAEAAERVQADPVVRKVLGLSEAVGPDEEDFCTQLGTPVPPYALGDWECCLGSLCGHFTCNYGGGCCYNPTPGSASCIPEP